VSAAGSGPTVRWPINLAEFEERARGILSPATFDYIVGGAADEHSLPHAGALFAQILLRPRVMVDVATCDASTAVLGHPVPYPILVAPTGDHGIAHPDGEQATASGVAAAGTVMIASSGSTKTLEEIAAAANGPRWLHLPLLRDRSVMAVLIDRAQANGYTALCLTIDHKVTALRERNVRNGWISPPPANLAGLLETDTADWSLSGSTTRRAEQVFDRAADWRYLDETVAMTELPVAVKGVLRGDDARLAVDHGAAAVIVSDHGARQLDTAVAPLQALGEVADAVADDAEIYLDGGIRRGTDVLKALALGARAVLIGRPVLYGLAVGGADGVAEVLRILADEFLTAMAMCGCPDLASIRSDLTVVPAAMGLGTRGVTR
jgi:isopentenyl diphosphate isomerase/L-lactate dehydrogenase-like FMN-dependent dehydrogenase